jgi:DNA-binding CsgD family transcriptional regulator
VIYYDSLHEAVFAAKMSATADTVSIDSPDEITLLADIVLDNPLIIDDGVHIRLVAVGDRTIYRSVNLIEFPVVWVRGEGASLTLGKPGMEHELVIDGGFLNSPPIEAHCPLAALAGPDAKLIMYDKVVLQNNYNNGHPLSTSFYENGAGVFIRTQDNISDRQAEFIMKGGIIRGNINDEQTMVACGGGVFIAGYGIFTMEGGVIMNNTAKISGGGFYAYSWASFKKTGGIIYGSDAPSGFRNTAMTGLRMPPAYGHAVGIVITVETFLGYRDDTVGENDNLSYIGSLTSGGIGIFGKGEKWDNPEKAFRRMLAAIVLPVLAVTAGVVIILRKRYVKKLAKELQEAVDESARAVPKIDLKNIDLADDEKEICELLLTDRPLKQIAAVLKLSYPGATHRAQNLYKKLGIENRTELLVRVKK